MRRAAALLAVLVFGCGSPPDHCHANSPCSEDPVKTSADIKACEDADLNPPKCHTEKTAFDDCFLAKAVCGSDNKTDPLQTFTACKSESDAYQACITK